MLSIVSSSAHYMYCVMQEPFTGTVEKCFNIVRHLQRTATITCSRNMPLSNRNDRGIELAIGIYCFRSWAIGITLQLEAGLHAPMPKHFHHTLSNVKSNPASLSGGSINLRLCTSYVSRCGIDGGARCSVVLLSFYSLLKAHVCVTWASRQF
jgi:hypothetical protein